MNEKGVLLMSGYSLNNLKFLDTSYTPLDLLLDTLLDERYENIFLLDNKEQNNLNVMHISNINLPQVNNVNQFINELQRFTCSRNKIE